MKLYGAEICGGCVLAKSILDDKGVPYTYVDITESTTNLKEFLALRDNNDLYKGVKEAGKIGIPTFLFSDGRINLDLYELDFQDVKDDYEKENSSEDNMCGLDGC